MFFPIRYTVSKNFLSLQYHDYSNKHIRTFERHSGPSRWENDTPIGKLLCITRRNARLTGLRKKTYAYGTGEYFNTSRKADEIFGNFLSYFTIIFQDQSFFLEFRLFGYRYFRQNGYFPIRWLRVRNSIHHQTLDKWISASRKRQIARGLKNGATMDIARTQEDIEAFFNMLRKYYAAKIHRYLPDLRFFLSLLKRPSEHELGKIFLIRYKNKIIGGSVCLFSQNTAYLLFSSGMRKTYPLLYPGVLAVWNAMTYSRQQGYRHFEFIEAGLPFKKYTYRVHPPFRRQAIKHPPLVPHPLEMAQPAAYSFLYLNAGKSSIQRRIKTKSARIPANRFQHRLLI